MTAQGHKGRFRPPRLSAGYGFSKETFTVGRGKEEEAPKAVTEVTTIEPVDSTIRREVTILLYDFVGEIQHSMGDGQPDRLGGLQVDDEPEFGRLLNWQIGGLGAFQDFVDIAGCEPGVIEERWPIAE